MRPSADQHFIDLAFQVAKRSTCARRHVGCVLVDINNHIIATGYNGVPRGMPHCRDNPRPVCTGRNQSSGTGLDLCQAIHAEQNALIQVSDAEKITTVYCTVAPCMHCVKMLMNTACQRLVFYHLYAHPGAEELWKSSGRAWISFKLEK